MGRKKLEFNDVWLLLKKYESDLDSQLAKTYAPCREYLIETRKKVARAVNQFPKMMSKLKDKKPSVHFPTGRNPRYSGMDYYDTACGHGASLKNISWNKSKVTCKSCKKATAFLSA